ncbi:MAG TPA: DUF5818 domain-containing protein [Verrucomicrobiae bacterium]|nr:DUF5818 domain-containing protein [Verrucomicrobiae bacterium]
MKTLWIMALAVLFLFIAAPAIGAPPSSVFAGGRAAAPVTQPSSAGKTVTTKVQTFTGTVARSGDLYVLQDDSTNTSFQLDDQESARKYNGRRVKVIGTLDLSTKTIHVEAIEVA